MGGTGVQTLSLHRYQGGMIRRVPRVLWCLVLAALLSVPSAATILPGLTSSASPAAKVDPSLLTAARQAPRAMERIIVRETQASSDRAENLVRSLGGRVTRELPIISSFSAVFPAGQVMDLAAAGSVTRVWADGKVRMSTDTNQINSSSGANTVWKQSIRLLQAQQADSGAGVTVALLDTGVSQTADLGNRVLARVDLTPDRDGLDHFGHGTHMAGIIAGDGSMSGGTWSGVAPLANLVSVKVSSVDGSTA